MKNLCIMAMLVLAVLSSGCELLVPRNGSVDSDVAIIDARVFTANREAPAAQAVAVKDKRIVYVGDNKGILDFIGPNTRVVNAKGKMLTPGFIDSHTHIVWLGILNAVITHVYAAENFDELSKMVKEFAAQRTDLPFVMAIGWKYDYIENGIPTLEMADAILADRPMILWSHDGHTGWVNSLALNHMQNANPDAFSRLTPEYDESGNPTGIFLHFYAINPFDFFPMEDFDEGIKVKMAQSLASFLDEGLAVGVTAHHDVMIHKDVFEILLDMRDLGAFDRARARCAYFLDHHVMEDEEQLLNDLDLWQSYRTETSDHLVMGESIKLGIDGVASNHTAFMFEPFSDAPGNYGIASWSQEGFDRLTSILDEYRFQICTHATGDAGANRVINSYEALRQASSDWDARHVIEHCSKPIPEDIARMAALNIHASMQPAHLFSDEVIERALGPERVERQHPCGSIQKSGVNIAFGTDYSIVPLNPIYGLLVAATRMNYHGGVWGKEEAISIEDGILHYTIDSAKTQKMEDIIGSLEVGKYGDMVLFDIDLQDVDNLWFMLTHNMGLGGLDNFVIMTLVDGNIVYYRDDERYK